MRKGPAYQELLMTNPDTNSVSAWIEQMKQGEDGAVQRLWDRYFQRMVEVARGRMPAHLRPAIGSEDIALSAFFDFVETARAAQLPQLTERQALWRILFTFTVRKAIDHLRHQHAQLRGGGQVVKNAPAQLEHLLDSMPSPEREVILRDQLDFLLAALPDEALRLLVLDRLDGWSNAEIAARHDCSERTVERRLQLVRKLWVECLDHE